MYSVSVCGCNAYHPAPFKMSRPKGISEYVLLYVRARADFFIDGRHYEVLPSQIVIINKNTPYHYESVNSAYTDDWIHFDCQDDECPALFTNMLNRPISLGNALRISLYIQQIVWEANYSLAEYQASNIHMLMQILLNHLKSAAEYSGTGKVYSPYYARMQEIRLNLASNPPTKDDASIIAASLNLSRSYFQRLYSEFFGISFHNDIILMRIEHAKKLLTGTTDTIESIAASCGYNSEVHFYRQFHKTTGMTPTEYRNNFC